MKAYILAGGKSSRMGEDKGLKLLLGKPLISYVIAAFKGIASEVVIVTNQIGYEQFNLPLVTDLVADKGPLSGIFTALSHTSDQEILVCSCDMPFVSKNAINELIRTYKGNTIVGSFADKTQPLFGIYNRDILALVENSINDDKLRMMQFLKEIHCHYLDFETLGYDNIFQNLNTPQEIAQAEILLPSKL